MIINKTDSKKQTAQTRQWRDIKDDDGCTFVGRREGFSHTYLYLITDRYLMALTGICDPSIVTTAVKPQNDDDIHIDFWCDVEINIMPKQTEA